MEECQSRVSRGELTVGPCYPVLWKRPLRNVDRFVRLWKGIILLRIRLHAVQHLEQARIDTRPRKLAVTDVSGASNVRIQMLISCGYFLDMSLLYFTLPNL